MNYFLFLGAKNERLQKIIIRGCSKCKMSRINLILLKVFVLDMNCDQFIYMSPNTSKLKICIESKHKQQCHIKVSMKVFAITVITVAIKLCVKVI